MTTTCTEPTLSDCWLYCAPMARRASQAWQPSLCTQFGQTCGHEQVAQRSARLECVGVPRIELERDVGVPKPGIHERTRRVPVAPQRECAYARQLGATHITCAHTWTPCSSERRPCEPTIRV